MNTNLTNALKSTILGRPLSMQEREAVLDELTNNRLKTEGVAPTRFTPTPAPGIHTTASASEVMHYALLRMAERNQRIEAIKMVRTFTGAGLKEAKDYVDRHYPRPFDHDQY